MAIEKKIIIDGDYSGLVKSAEQANEANEGLLKSVNSVTKSVDDLSDSSKKSKKGFEEAEKGTKGLSGGFKAIGASIKAAGIGLVIGLLVSLKEIFMENQKVADVVNTVFETISLTFNQIVNTITNVIEAVSESTNGFEGMKKVVGGLITIALAPLKLYFYALKLGIKEMQLAWEQSMFGDNDPVTVKRLNEEIKNTVDEIENVKKSTKEAGKQVVDNFGKAVSEVGTVVEKTSEGISKISIKANYNSAQQIIQLKKQAELAGALNQGLIEQYDLQVESLRQIRDEERNSIAVRKKANDDIKIALEEQAKLMKENAQKALDAAQADYDKNQSQENYLALLEAQNEVMAVQAQVNGFMSEQKANDLALYREELELAKAKTDGELEAIQIIEDAKAEAIINETERQAELDRLELERYEAKKLRLAEELQAMVDNGQAETQAYIDKLNEQKLAEAEHQAYLINTTKERADKQKEIEEVKQGAINGIANQGLDFALKLASEGTKLGKALGVAQTLYSTYEGVQSAFTTASKSPYGILNPAYPYIQAGLAGAFGLSNLTKLKSVSTSISSPSSASISVPSGSSVASAINSTPQINIVGQQQGNAILEGINNNTANPIKAYVVAKDVTTQQELDRNRVQSATL